MVAERALAGANMVFIGGATGIGFAAAQAVARRGASVFVVVRDPSRARAAAQALREAGAPEAGWAAADVSTVAGIERAVAAITSWRGALHGLVHSAMTVKFLRRAQTDDGLELAFGLQYLARHALNRALLAPLAASGDGRIVHVRGKAPAGTLPDLDDLQFERRRWSLVASLMSSQVLGYLHVQEATRRWRALPVSATIACVGMTRTKGTSELPWGLRHLYHLFSATPERAAENVVRALTIADAGPLRGAAFFDPRRPVATTLDHDPALAAAAWARAESLLHARGFLIRAHPGELAA